MVPCPGLSPNSFLFFVSFCVRYYGKPTLDCHCIIASGLSQRATGWLGGQLYWLERAEKPPGSVVQLGWTTLERKHKSLVGEGVVQKRYYRRIYIYIYMYIGPISTEYGAV